MFTKSGKFTKFTFTKSGDHCNTLQKNFPLKNPTNCPAIFIKIFYASPFRRLLAFASLALHPLRKMQKT